MELVNPASEKWWWVEVAVVCVCVLGGGGGRGGGSNDVGDIQPFTLHTKPSIQNLVKTWSSTM